MAKAATTRDDETDSATREISRERDPRPNGEGVAQRAYERFQMRGGEHGRDQEDWFEAERELKEGTGE